MARDQGGKAQPANRALPGARSSPNNAAFVAGERRAANTAAGTILGAPRDSQADSGSFGGENLCVCVYSMSVPQLTLGV